MVNLYNRYLYIFSFLCLSIFFILIFHIYYKFTNTISNDKITASSKIIISKDIERDELNELFNIYLNSFKSDIKKHAYLYKASRRVLNEILSPFNFENPEYTKETYYFFKNHIAPDLRNKSRNVISIFEKYTDQLNEDIKNIDSDIAETFLLKWQDMGEEQLKKYVDFFIKEEEVIKAYEDIIEFYYIHSNLISLNEDETDLVFVRKEDEIKENLLLDKIKSLKEN